MVDPPIPDVIEPLVLDVVVAELPVFFIELPVFDAIELPEFDIAVVELPEKDVGDITAVAAAVVVVVNVVVVAVVVVGVDEELPKLLKSMELVAKPESDPFELDPIVLTYLE